ncbi:MAG: hypothetical protein RL701_6167 [Pseudomonadota bacterium]|jgi:hypothetical protein
MRTHSPDRVFLARPVIGDVSRRNPSAIGVFPAS